MQELLIISIRISYILYVSAKYFCWSGSKPVCLLRGKMCDGNQECDDGSDESPAECEAMPKCWRYKTKGRNGISSLAYIRFLIILITSPVVSSSSLVQMTLFMVNKNKNILHELIFV